MNRTSSCARAVPGAKRIADAGAIPRTKKVPGPAAGPPARRVTQRCRPDSEDVFDHLERWKDRSVETLVRYLRIPSISTDPAYAPEVDRCCDFLVSEMRAAGLEARKIPTEGHPLAYGEWLGAPGRPTILFYGHYDVQPPDPLDAWTHPPFEPTAAGDCLVARGATDDKGQSFTHLAAVRAMLERRGELPVNVKFLVEGEEESGGGAIDRFVRRDRGATLGCDGVVISDGDLFAPGRPCLLYGLRGYAAIEIEVEGPERDLHSGTFGGAVTNPIDALCRMIGHLHDPRTGRIAIPRFYEDVVPLDEAERRSLAELPFDAEDYARGLGVGSLAGEEGYTTPERLWVRPACDVNGIWGGYQGRGGKTVLPSRAGAKLSFRLVPNQDPVKITELACRYLRSIRPRGVKVTFERGAVARAVRMATEGPVLEAAAAALEQTWGRPPLWVRDGGSLPVVSTFAETLGVSVALMGFGLADDGAHAPDERFRLSHFHRGTRTIVRFLDLLGDRESGGGSRSLRWPG